MSIRPLSLSLVSLAVGELPPPGTLVVASTLLETPPGEEVVAGMARYTPEISGGQVRAVRFCSDDVASLVLLESRLTDLGALAPVGTP